MKMRRNRNDERVKKNEIDMSYFKAIIIFFPLRLLLLPALFLIFEKLCLVIVSQSFQIVFGFKFISSVVIVFVIKS